MDQIKLSNLIEESDYLIKIRSDLDIDFPPGVAEYAIACPEGIYQMVMELKSMYKKAVSEYYTIILRNYDEVYMFQTNEYNEDVLNILGWYTGRRFDVSAVFKNAVPIEIKESMFQSKKKLQEELEWKKYSFWFDEEGEELEEKIRQLMSVIYEEEE